MKQLEIKKATDDQLRSFIVTNLQIEDADKADTRAKLMGLLGKANWQQDFIFVDDDGSAAQGEIVSPEAKFRYTTGRDDGPLVKCIVRSTEGVGGKHPAPVNVNGRKLMVMRNAVVDLPYAFYLAFKNATQTKFTDPGSEIGGKQQPFERTDYSNYPVEVIERPSQAEIDAWHARNGSRELGEQLKVAA